MTKNSSKSMTDLECQTAQKIIAQKTIYSEDKTSLGVLESCFVAHGIGEEYLKSWFKNYIADTQEQKKALTQIIAGFYSNRPMAFLGTIGGGKTHLAQAIVKSHLYYKREAYYYTLSSLFRDYRRSLKDDEFSEKKFFERVTSCHCLVIDEFNLSSNSDAEKRIIYEILDMRYSAGKQTIFCANMSVEKFKKVISERIVDRLRERELLVIMFNWPSYREAPKREKV